MNRLPVSPRLRPLIEGVSEERRAQNMGDFWNQYVPSPNGNERAMEFVEAIVLGNQYDVVRPNSRYWTNVMYVDDVIFYRELGNDPVLKRLFLVGLRNLFDRDRVDGRSVFSGRIFECYLMSFLCHPRPDGSQGDKNTIMQWFRDNIGNPNSVLYDPNMNNGWFNTMHLALNSYLNHYDPFREELWREELFAMRNMVLRHTVLEKYVAENGRTYYHLRSNFQRLQTDATHKIDPTVGFVLQIRNHYYSDSRRSVYAKFLLGAGAGASLPRLVDRPLAKIAQYLDLPQGTRGPGQNHRIRPR